MPNKVHYYSLLARHYALELKIATEVKRPMPNIFVVQRLKRRRLVVKDKIEAYRRRFGEPNSGLPATSA